MAEGEKGGSLTQVKLTTRAAYMAIVTFGIVSMMGDTIYEGGRGLIPEYLRFIGASAIVVGIVTGAGEFLGYAARLLSGALADRTRAYWLFIFLGYGLIVAVPFLGLTGIFELAILLVLLERLGKALRSPSRDAVISIVSKGIGSGKAFGLHEFLDQIGAVAGPALVAAMMFYSGNNYSTTFTFLFIPYAGLVLTLLYTYKNVGRSVHPEARVSTKAGKWLNRDFNLYVASVGLNTIGLVPVALILYQASLTLTPAQQWLIPVLYLVVQAVDAPISLISGIVFDRIGLKVLVLPYAFSFLPALFVSYRDLTAVILACVTYGVVLGMQESIYRAAVSEIVPPEVRGTAYGVFNTVLGLGLLVAGSVFGLLIDRQVMLVLSLTYVAATQAFAILLLLRTIRRTKNIGDVETSSKK